MLYERQSFRTIGGFQVSLYDETPQVMTVREAGWRYLGLKEKASYEAVKRGDIPVLKIGNLLKVPIRAMERKLEQVERKAHGKDEAASGET
jgi:hypothetical protein